MAAQGATLQNYNNELVKSIEDLREKREELNRHISNGTSSSVWESILPPIWSEVIGKF